MALGGIFDYAAKIEKLADIRERLSDSKVWADPVTRATLGREQVELKKVTVRLDALQTGLAEAEGLLDLAEPENDQEMLSELGTMLIRLEAEVCQLESARMFSDVNDSRNAYLDVQAGSGGTEAQDWAEMLLRMYLRFAERRGFNTVLIEASPGEAAGIKSATVHVRGDHAFGWLRTETGVHRLVRKSPFDSGHRRHTSFASVFVSPELDSSFDVQINPSELRVDTYRAQGAGGQHVNKTDSAVRITHVPTGVVVQCQSDRSQHRNRSQAMKQLRAKLYELEKLKRDAEKQSREEAKLAIGWGSQIRSYVLDQSRIKDLRTGHESGKVQDVLDGGLDAFIEVSLKQGVT